MDVALPSGVTVPSHDFFIRARARLSLDVPAALNDHAAEAKRGDAAGGGAHSGGRPARAGGAADAAY